MLSHNGEEKSSGPFSEDGDSHKIVWKKFKNFHLI